MNWRWVTAALSIGLCAAPSAWARGACLPSTTPIRIDFQTRSPDPHYDNSLNVTAIRNLFRARGQAIAGPHTQALGVTFFTPAFSIDVNTRVVRSGDGYCVLPDAISAEFGFRSLDVYIASEYVPGSCEYRTVLDHENQHVAINRAALKDSAPQIRAALEVLLAYQAPVFDRDPQRATRAIADDLSHKMDATLEIFRKQLDDRNGRIDTDANYAATAELCRNWDRGNVWPQQENRRQPDKKR